MPVHKMGNMRIEARLGEKMLIPVWDMVDLRNHRAIELTYPGGHQKDFVLFTTVLLASTAVSSIKMAM